MWIQMKQRQGFPDDMEYMRWLFQRLNLCYLKGDFFCFIDLWIDEAGGLSIWDGVLDLKVTVCKGTDFGQLC